LRKRRYHHGDLRTALMHASVALIAKHGVQGLALSDAAHQAGVSVAAPYRHFKDKEALLAEIAREGFVKFRDGLARALETHPNDKVKRLVEMGVAYVDFALKHRAHFKVMWEGGLKKDKYPELAEAAHQAYLLLEAAVLDLLPAAAHERQQALITAAWTTVHGFASLTLEKELEVAGATQNHELLRNTLHILLDQFRQP
jgi:AcrR family transcriptional regulator